MKNKTFSQLVKEKQADKPDPVKVGYVVDRKTAERFADLCVRLGVSQSKGIQFLMERALGEEKP